MLNEMKQSFRGLSEGTPGMRFTEHHEARRREKGEQSVGKTSLYIGIGIALLVIGLLLSIPPGVPGFLLWLPALGLVASRFRPAAVLLDRAEMLLRRLFRIRST